MNVRSAVATVPLIVGFLVSAEVTARVDDWIRLDVPFWHTPDSEIDLHIADSLGLRGRPHGRYQQFQLNNFGFRGPDISAQPRAGCTRIIILGASETFGYFETPGQEYPAQLRDSLGTRRCFDVVNAGLAGMGLRSIIHFWNTYADRFGARIVVVYAGPTFYLGNELPRWPVAPRGTSSAHAPWRPRLSDRLHNVVSTPDFIQQRRLQRWIADATRGKPANWFFTVPPPDRLAAFVTDLDSLVRTIRADGAVPVVMTHAMRFSTPALPDDEFLLLAWRRFTPRATSEAMVAFEHAAAQLIRDYAACAHVSVVDVDSAMSGRRRLFEDPIHFTDEGASVVAGLIARQLIRDVATTEATADSSSSSAVDRRTILSSAQPTQHATAQRAEECADVLRPKVGTPTRG
jgi:hypothetical protein